MAVPQSTTDLKSTSGLTLFYRETKNEMKKVTWPTRQELIAYTIVVVIATFFCAAAIWGIDAIFAQIFRLLMGVQG